MKNSNSGHCVQDPSDACFTTVPHDNDSLLSLGLCVSWHLTVVHNYIIANSPTYSLPKNKVIISLPKSSQETGLLSSGKLCQGLLNPLSDCFSVR